MGKDLIDFSKQKYFIDTLGEIWLCYSCSTKNRNTLELRNIILQNISKKIYKKKMCIMLQPVRQKNRKICKTL